MLRILLVCLSILVTGMMSAQDFISGTVVDPGSRKPVAAVKVAGSYSGVETLTDDSGGFSFRLNILTDSSMLVKPAFSILHNHLFFNSKEPILAEIFTLNGARLLTKQMGNSGTMPIPVHAAGYNLLQLTSGALSTSFLLFSDGQNIFPGKSPRFHAQQPLFDGAIALSKEGYFDRTIKLNSYSKNMIISLLRKSYDSLDYFAELPCHEAFEMLHSSPPLSNFGEIQSVKVLYDFVDDHIYYINLAKYPSHFSFAEKILGYPYGSVNFFWTQYYTSPKRFLHLATINYHTQIGKYVFEFDPYDMVDCAGIEATYRKITETSFFGDKLFFYPNNLRWSNCTQIPAITAEELYRGQNYQAMNLEEGFGYLRKIETGQLAGAYPGHHDIVLLNGIPNDISVVSGIITTEFQTALSHINILSHNRRTPNMVLRDGFTNPALDSLLGKLVYLKVESNTFTIRRATLAEATTFWQEREPTLPVVLEKDLTLQGIVELHDASIASVNSIGGKAANFAELVNLQSIPLPEDHFAIPFYYYEQHITSHRIDTLIDQMLTDVRFFSDQAYRDEKLLQLRNRIIEAPLDPAFLSLVLTRIHSFQFFDAYKFRSSTNAEDLESFSGAGLYDSFAAKRGSSSKSVDKAIKKVWASLWNLRAFDEREYYKIDQHSVAMGILVNRSSPDEEANGVIITKNLYSGNHAYTVNVQYKEFSVVSPEPGVMHDQVLIHTISLDTLKYTLEYIARSNIPALEGNTVLTDAELYQIGDLCTLVKEHYFYHLPHQGNCSYNDFAVDIEFKIDSQVSPHKIYFKQARIYSGN